MSNVKKEIIESLTNMVEEDQATIAVAMSNIFSTCVKVLKNMSEDDREIIEQQVAILAEVGLRNVSTATILKVTSGVTVYKVKTKLDPAVKSIKNGVIKVASFIPFIN